MTAPRTDHGFVSRVVGAFLHGNLSILLILVMLGCGVAALALTPREEEPQIVVPLADIFVRMPGATAEEVEQQVSSRLERLLDQIDGVEYVYSMSRPGEAVVTVRFFVGENREDEPRQVAQQDHDEHGRGPAGRHGLGGQTGRDRRRSARERHSLEQDERRLRPAPRRRAGGGRASGRSGNGTN